MAASEDCPSEGNEPAKDSSSTSSSDQPKVTFLFVLQMIIFFVYSGLGMLRAFFDLLPLFCPLTPAQMCKQYADWRRYIHEVGHSRTTSRFNYRQLSNDHAIRLLTVLPGERSDVLSCALSEVDIREQPTYTALSYVWAVWTTRNLLLMIGFVLVIVFPELCFIFITIFLPETLSKFCSTVGTIFGRWTQAQRMVDALREWCMSEGLHLVLCNGGHLYVRKNLYEFLLQARERRDNTRYWIDAISINQDDVFERSQQVTMMTAIYSSAERVIAWLGTCPSLLHSPDIIGRAHLSLEQSHLDEPALLLVTPADALRAFARYYLVSLGYFTRTWIIQECTIPKELVFMIGPFSLSSEHMLEAARLANTGPIASDAIGILNLFGCSTPTTVLAILRGREDFRKKGTWSLSDYVAAATGHVASDPRDMIYAGLGLVSLVEHHPVRATIHVPDKNQQHVLQLRPDYTLATADVFVACGLSLLHEKGLTALSYTCDGRCMTRHEDDSIPSWVPHFESRLTDMLDGSDRFSAGGHDRADLELLSNNCLLLRSGARYVGTIESLFKSDTPSVVSNILALLDEQPEVYVPTREAMITAIARTVVADHIEDNTHGTSSITDSLVEVICEDLALKLRLDERSIRSQKSYLRFLPSYLVLSSSVQHEVDNLMGAAEEKRKYAQLQARHASFTSRFVESKQAKGTNNKQTSIDQSRNPRVVQEHEARLNNDDATMNDTGCTDTHSAAPEALLALRTDSQLPYAVATRRRMRRRCIFTTKEGYIGIGSSYLKVGDQIMVLAGACVPYAMHKAGAEGELRYHMRGEVYVHGMMYGELVSGNDWAPLQLVIE